ncbi:unnamed protein product, partial [marine sediment metagenome]
MKSAPAAPSGATAHYVATNNAKVTWTDNSNNEDGFCIERMIDGATSWTFWKNVNPNVTDSGTYTLGANHRIKFRVRAYNVAGVSGWSESGYIYSTPDAPSGATGHVQSGNQTKVTWTDNSNYEEGF